MIGVWAFLLVDAAHALCPGSFLQARPLIHPLATSPAGPRLSIAKTPAGLVNSRSCGEFYTQDLRPEDVHILLASDKSDTSLWAMAQLDAKAKGVTTDDYLASVQKELLDFFQKREDDSREVWGRVQMLEALRSALATTGQFAMLLGGKNCGKSTVLKNVAGTAEILMETGQVGRVLYVDCRGTGSDLDTGIITAVSTNKDLFANFVDELRTSLPQMAGAISTGMGLPGGEVVADMLKKLLASETDGIQAVEAFVKAAQNRNEYPILIIDEANLAFSPDVSKNKPILDKLVQLTKQQREMMTLFTSSEYAYPYKLDRIGFNQADLTNVIYAGEIPPKEMRELLVSRLGMGDRLADGFLSAFGGHIYTTEYALQGLASEREQFAPLMVAQGGLCGNITQALAEEGKYPGITDLMSQLAVTGFAPVDTLMDPRAERLTFLGIAGGVTYQNKVIGLKKDAWLRPPPPQRRTWWRRLRGLPLPGVGPHKAGLVPTSEMCRLLILLELQKAPLST